MRHRRRPVNYPQVVDRAYTAFVGRTSDAEQRLLDAATDLMGRRGYGAAGVAEICRSADVQKGSFYHYFDSKQALTVALITAHWEEQRADWRRLLLGAGPALVRLERLMQAQVEAQRDGQARRGRVYGCLLGNLAIELSNQDEAVTAHLARVFDEQVALVLATLVEAAAEGAVAADVAVEQTARAVVAQLEGLVLFAKLANDPSVLDGLWPQVRRLLGIDAGHGP